MTGNEELARQGDTLQLWKQNRGLLYKIVQRYQGRSPAYDIEDLMQAAYLGLCKAVEGYDPSRGVKFMTYAQKAIQAEARRMIGLNGRQRAHNDAVSIGDEIAEGLTIADTLEDTSLEAMDDVAIRVDNGRIVREVVDKRLHSTRAAIIRRYYFDKASTAAIAEEFGIPASRVHTLRAEGLSTLRKRFELRQIWTEGQYFRHKSLKAYRSSWTSAVEEVAIWREERSHDTRGNGNHDKF